VTRPSARCAEADDPWEPPITGASIGRRFHVCSRCTTDLNRDHNAARNILALGLQRREEITAGHAESNAWGQSALYLAGKTSLGTAAR